MALAIQNKQVGHSAAPPPPARPRSPAPPFGWPIVMLRTAMVLWAAFWSLFAVLSAWSGGISGAQHALAFIAVIASPVAIAWRYPRLGGLALLAVGAWCMWYFHNPGTQAALGAPSSSAH
jgi:hypothetical protein